MKSIDVRNREVSVISATKMRCKFVSILEGCTSGGSGKLHQWMTGQVSISAISSANSIQQHHTTIWH